MRRKVLLGMGLAGLLSGSAAVGQFVPNRGPASPGAAVPFGGAQPPAPATTGFASVVQPGAAPSAPAPPPATLPAAAPPTPARSVPPVGGFNPAPAGPPAPATGFQPAAGTQPRMPAQPSVPATPLDADLSALGANHPWAVRPEHGAFFICVKSYSRPHRPDPNDPGMTARELAEGLGQEIRETQRVNVFLFEYISEEKKAEMAAAAAARQRAQAFLAAADQYRQKSQLQGMEFLEPDRRIYYKTFNYRDQIAVLVGGFATEDDAVKYLAKVKKWPAPRNESLMDGGAIASRDAAGRPVIEKTRLNPFPQAMVVPNPSVPKTAAAAGGATFDPFLVKLNEGNRYSLLTATKPWTLGVKSFSSPVTIQSREDNGGMMRRFGLSSGADALNAGAEQAEQLAEALRKITKGPRGEPLVLEAFVLHTRTGSIVTVGQFDGPSDPALLETRRVLMNLKFNVAEDPRGAKMVGTGQNLFGDNILPIPVPRAPAPMPVSTAR